MQESQAPIRKQQLTLSQENQTSCSTSFTVNHLQKLLATKGINVAFPVKLRLRDKKEIFYSFLNFYEFYRKMFLEAI